jgi:hypothetical protein
MKIIVHFPSVSAIRDERGELTQDKVLLVEWLKGQLGHQFFLSPLGYTIRQELNGGKHD